MYAFMSGALALASCMVALFFCRFWQLTRDRLFLYFALSFGLLAVQWAGLGFAQPLSEARHALYVVRLGAFLLLLAGIVEKNMARPRR